MKTTFLTMIILLLLATACSPAPSDMLVLTEKDEGTTVEVQQGQIFQVTLQGNMTTGYNWIVAPLDPAILEVQGDPEFKPDSNLVGSPGTISYKFKALSTGEVTLHLDYQRPWEETIPPEKTYEVTIIVK